MRLVVIASWLKKACNFQDISILATSGHFLPNLIIAIGFLSENNLQVSATLMIVFLLLDTIRNLSAAWIRKVQAKQKVEIDFIGRAKRVLPKGTCQNPIRLHRCWWQMLETKSPMTRLNSVEIVNFRKFPWNQFYFRFKYEIVGHSLISRGDTMLKLKIFAKFGIS